MHCLRYVFVTVRYANSETRAPSRARQISSDVSIYGEDATQEYEWKFARRKSLRGQCSGRKQ